MKPGLGLRAGVRLAILVPTLLATGLEAQEVLSWGAMQREIEARPTTPALRVDYGLGETRFGELGLPSGPGPHPVAIVVHGGCWLSLADLTYMRPLAAELNRLGWATWTLEFNRIDQPGGRWPGILEDVARGADALRELAERHPLDLGRVVAVGHSSGGHLALWLAARSGAVHRSPPLPGAGDDPLAVHGVVGLAPVSGLEDFQARSDRCGPTIVADLLGAGSPDGDGGPEEGRGVRERRLDVTDPGRLVPLGAPQLLIHGEEDRIVPVAHGIAWERRASEEGDDVQVRVVPGAGHFEVVAPWTDPWPLVEGALRSFLTGIPPGA